MKSGGVALEPALVLKPTFDEVEGDLRQSPPRHAVEVFDIDGLIEVHGPVLSSARLKGDDKLRARFLSQQKIGAELLQGGGGRVPLSRAGGERRRAAFAHRRMRR